MVTFHIIIRLGSAVQNVIDSNPGLKVNIITHFHCLFQSRIPR